MNENGRRLIMLTANRIIEFLYTCDNEQFVDEIVSHLNDGVPFTDDEIARLSAR